MKFLKLDNKKPQLIFCIHKGIESEKMFADPVVAEKFISTMEKYESFSNLSICTYALVNHECYILLRQHPEEDITAETLLSKIKYIISEEQYDLIISELNELKKPEHEEYVEKLKNTYVHRMNDYREFFRTLKVSFSSWYNGYVKKRDKLEFRRSGHVFSSKFKRVLVEDKMDASKVIASYIDLLPLRANVTTSLKKYNYSNFGAALNGNKKAQKRLVDFFNYYMAEQFIAWTDMNKKEQQNSWNKFSQLYDNILFEDVETIVDKDGCSRRGISKERFLEATEHRSKKRLTINEATHCHTKYFTHGTAFGTKEFCEKMFNDSPKLFSENRKDGARRMLKLDKDIELFTLHQIQLNVIRPPDYLDITKELEKRNKQTIQKLRQDSL